eukprot:TRINITY_DN7667_c0_g1_i7.p1 TRINITY_DN7667_c0_g1~~TRINITY_DN7667_c0_g1_i7.p1  ORF type:complete len:155 (+),score=42.92 TRINITY_DN7667_c0_g1_i7:70-465(+)
MRNAQKVYFQLLFFSSPCNDETFHLSTGSVLNFLAGGGSTCSPEAFLFLETVGTADKTGVAFEGVEGVLKVEGVTGAVTTLAGVEGVIAGVPGETEVTVCCGCAGSGCEGAGDGCCDCCGEIIGARISYYK